MKATSKELIKNKIPKVKGIIKKNYNLSKLTWFKVGGNAELYFAPRDKEDLINFLKNLDKKIPIQILGAGSNTLIRDGGISGVTLKLTKSFCEIIYLRNQKFIAGAGLSCVKLARTLANKNLKGLEFFLRYTRYSWWCYQDECWCIWKSNIGLLGKNNYSG